MVHDSPWPTSGVPLKPHHLFAALTLSALGQELPLLATGMARIRLIAADEGNSRLLEIVDPGNHSWCLQSSTDLGSWSDGPRYRVFNGALRIPAPGAGPQHFFRLNPDLAEPLPSTAADALRLPGAPFNYANLALTAAFLSNSSGSDNQPLDNVVTDAGAALGRVLFYDKRLSANQTVSCSSCHQREHGFADPRPLSVGFGGTHTGRNSMGLTNARFYRNGRFLWDERAATLEEQVLMPIQDPVEMGLPLPVLIERLEAEPFYRELFTTAFGTAEIDSTRISRALAQFIRSIASTKSKFDAGITINFSNFTTQEAQGRALFTAFSCAVCHMGQNFIPLRPRANGLEFPLIDTGLGEVSDDPATDGLFKVTSLRNIELTAPYMHDGRFQTLEEVVEFYNSGISDHPNLDPSLRKFAKPQGMNLSAGQKAALVAFLKTLTDTSVTSDEKFSDPFRYQAE